MDILQACEDLAHNVTSFDSFEYSEDNIPKDQIQRWQDLFSLTAEEAAKELHDWRADFGRASIPFLVWQEISQQKKSLGFDKESYEYSLSPRWLSRHTKVAETNFSFSYSSSTNTQAEITYLVKLEGDIPDAATLQQLAGLPTPPEVKTGDGETIELFGVIDGQGKVRLLANLPRGRPVTIIPVSMARKDLSWDSAYPTLGLETTLPQNRAHSLPAPSNQKLRPPSGLFPVWYFFYGTLADEERLGRLLGPDHPISLPPAWITGGRLGTWAGKYKALMDDFCGGRVDGHAFLVQDQQAEDALRYYETGVYEVVRYEIHLEDPVEGANMVKGLTFRYIGGKADQERLSH
ncbi:hypothetical protein HJFPF1_13383 [Paramyrothecium foliicola]|nr:hypothetical protein HJFPF1_13383 [Paramyrothecium foliicola]